MARFLPFLLVIGILAPAVHAERADREKEVVLLADKGTADDNKKVSIFEGNVIITQGTMRVTAAKVTLSEKDNFKFYVAQGAPVTFRQKRDKSDDWVEGTAERAEFDDKNEVVKLFNRAKVKSAQNELTGEFISCDMRRDVCEVTGAEKSRVKMILLPKNMSTPGKQEPPKEPLTLKPDKDMK